MPSVNSARLGYRPVRDFAEYSFVELDPPTRISQ